MKWAPPPPPDPTRIYVAPHTAAPITTAPHLVDGQPDVPHPYRLVGTTPHVTTRGSEVTCIRVHDWRDGDPPRDALQPVDEPYRVLSVAPLGPTWGRAFYVSFMPRAYLVGRTLVGQPDPALGYTCRTYLYDGTTLPHASPELAELDDLLDRLDRSSRR